MPQSGDGPRKGGPKKAHLSSLLVEATTPPEAFHYSGRNNDNNINLRVGTWNVRTMLDLDSANNDVTRPRRRSALIALELERYKIDMAALSETRLSGEGSLTEDGGGYTFYWKGHPEGQPRHHGVGLAIRNELMAKIVEAPTFINERLLTLRIPLVKGEHVTVISCYAPTLTSEESLKDNFYEQLHQTLSSIHKDDKIILLGDFNARVGREASVWDGVIGRNGVGKMNSNGLRLLTLCCEFNLTITNTIFRMKNRYKTSWMHPRSKHWHLIDYVIVRKRDLKFVKKTSAIRGAECSTDHRLIASDIMWKIRPKRRQAGVTKRKLNCEALQDPILRQEFQVKVGEALQSSPVDSSLDLDAQWNQISTTLRSAAEESIGFRARQHRDWFDENRDDIRTLIASKNAAHDALLRNPNSSALRQRFADLRATVQRETRRMENEWWINLAREIQGYADENDTHRFYDTIKKAYGPTSRSTLPVRSADGRELIRDARGISVRWAEHFSTLLNSGIEPDSAILNDIGQVGIKHQLDMPPTMEEIEGSVHSLNNRKSPGGDGIPAEIYKYGGTPVLQCLYQVISAAWTAETIPQAWKDSLIITLYKNKGDKADCGNSRGISLLSVAGKVLAKILLKRLIKHISEDLMPETQCGFRQNRSTSDMIFVARQTLEKCREQFKDLHICFVDLSKAFDTVDRPLLWEILRCSGCPPKFINLVRLLHEGMEARVRVGSLESDPFNVSRGVKQGCTLAPVLFNLYVSYITRLLAAQVGPDCGININYRMDRNLFDLQKLKARTKIKQSWFLELQYADDCAILSHTTSGLQEAISKVKELYTRFGLEINVRKTEVLHWTCENPQAITPEIMICDTPLTVSSSFKYLGAFIANDCKLDTELNNRICQASKAMGRLRDRVFKNQNLSLHTKIKVYTAVCLSSLLYGSEAWTLYARQLRLLEAWHIKSLRSIMGVTWRDKLTYEEMYRRTGSGSLESQIGRRQLRWIGHVIRMDDSRVPKQILYGELSTGRRKAGGQRKRHKDHVKTTLKKFEIPPDMLETYAADRSGWRARCHEGEKKCLQSRNELMGLRRQRRHQQDTIVADGSFPCTICDKVCRSRIGLLSHLKAHQQRRRGDGTVVVTLDGPP